MPLRYACVRIWCIFFHTFSSILMTSDLSIYINLIVEDYWPSFGINKDNLENFLLYSQLHNWSLFIDRHRTMYYTSVMTYIFVVLFAMSFVLVQANKEREKFADLLQKRKHLNGYWVGKRYAIASDEDPFDSGESKLFHIKNHRFCFLHSIRRRFIRSKTCFIFGW